MARPLAAREREHGGRMALRRRAAHRARRHSTTNAVAFGITWFCQVVMLPG